MGLHLEGEYPNSNKQNTDLYLLGKVSRRRVQGLGQELYWGLRVPIQVYKKQDLIVNRKLYRKEESVRG